MTNYADAVQVQLLKSFDVAKLQADLHVLANKEFQPQPGWYHAGEWKGVALWGAKGGDSAYSVGVLSEEMRYQPTEYLAEAPYIREVLEGLEMPLMVVRILSLPPGGKILRHSDGFGPTLQAGRVRLHIPIITHEDVVFMINDERCRWRAGEFWWGDFEKEHEVENKSPITRYHIVIDSEINEATLALFPPGFIEARAKHGPIPVKKPTLALDPAKLEKFVGPFAFPGSWRYGEARGRFFVRGSSLIADTPHGELIFDPVDETTFVVRGLTVTLKWTLADGAVKSAEIIEGLERVPLILGS